MNELIKAANAHPDIDIISVLKNADLVHFTDYGREILKEGFRYCATAENLGWTPGTKRVPVGYVFAFWLDGFDCSKGIPEFEVPFVYTGMKRTQGVIFKGSGIYVRNIKDGFNHVLLESDKIDLSKAVVLGNADNQHLVNLSLTRAE